MFKLHLRWTKGEDPCYVHVAVDVVQRRGKVNTLITHKQRGLTRGQLACFTGIYRYYR